MPASLRVAVLSFWHVHARDYAKDTVQQPDAELVAVWDDDAGRGGAGADSFGVEFVPDLDALLARDDIDAVVITTSTDVHRDIMVRAAAAGKHIFTEKLLAPTVAECEEIIAACDRAGVTLTVSLPRLNHGSTIAIREIVEAGSLGRVTYGRVRLSHDGATAGWLPDRFFDPVPAIGGALTDLGCHPVYLTQLFLGARPDSVSSTYGHVTERVVEDHAVVTLGYADQAIGVIEAGFVSDTPFTIDVFGTEGTVSWSDRDHRLVATGKAFGEGPVELPVAEDAEGAYGQWIGHIRQGTRAQENLDRAVELTRLVVAANASAAECRPVGLG